MLPWQVNRPCVWQLSVHQMGERGGLGTRRLSFQSHAGFLGSPTCLFVITWNAGSNHIVPRVRTVPDPWDYMIQSHILPLLATVLTGERVAPENLSTGQFSRKNGAANIVEQANDGWQLKRHRDRSHDNPAILDHLSFISQKQREGAALSANIERLIILIEDEDGLTQSPHPLAKRPPPR